MRVEPSRLPILETERLRLAPLCELDLADLSPLMDDPEVMAFRDSAEIDDPQLVAEIVRGQIAGMAQGAALYWSVRTLAERRFLGVFDLVDIDGGHKRAEVGFLLGREAWADGYAFEALRAVVSYAGACGLRKLSARTHIGNRRAEAMVRKLGFKLEGLLRGHILRDGERRDCHVFGLLL